MGAHYFLLIVWASAGELPPIFQLDEEEEGKGVLAEPARVDDGGFTISPPADWEVRAGGTRFLAPAVGRFQNSLDVKRYYTPAGVDEFARLVKDDLEKRYQPLRVVAEEAFEGGKGGVLKGKALTVDYTEYEEDLVVDLRSRYYFIDLGDSKIVAVGVVRREKFEEFEGQLDASVKSLSIFGPGYERLENGAYFFPGEGYSFRLRTDMSLRHEWYDGTLQLEISSPGKVLVRLRISKLRSTSPLRVLAQTYAAKVPGVKRSRYEDAAYECWLIRASRSERVIHQFLLGRKKEQFIISTTTRSDSSDVARDVIEQIVGTFRLTGR